jgi:hypothetical protein
MDLAELEKIGRQRAAALDKLAAINAHARTAAQTAHAAGIPETQLAVALRVDRLTIRRWLGK